MKRYIRSSNEVEDVREVLQQLARKGFSIGRVTTQRSNDCIDDDISLPNYTHNEDVFLTDNYLPIELKDIPGKYVWVGNRGRGRNKYSSIANTALKIAEDLGGTAIDFTPDTSMFFVFIPE